MLSKDKRLNLKKDFKWVAAGKKLETQYIKLFIKHGDNKIPKVGIALSSKYFKKATERNLAKRLVSAAFESLYQSLPTTINIVALPKHRVIKVKSTDVLLDLEEGLKKAEVL
ncbi:ribonuclease P protein component [Candidatus Daviesbacteria bacterium]|nr:ribonuclease P protein component [Candidatus Daviesbacteria bacterium]